MITEQDEKYAIDYMQNELRKFEFNYFGNCQPHVFVLEKLFKQHFNGSLKKGLEIGTWLAALDRYLISKFPNLYMTTIDIINRMPYFKPFFSQDQLNRINFIIRRSDEAVELVKGEQFDFIYIDGNHTYEQVKKDIINYLPLVRPGGILGGHDYTEEYWGVRKAVDETLKNVHFGEDMTWWVYV